MDPEVGKLDSATSAPLVVFLCPKGGSMDKKKDSSYQFRIKEQKKDRKTLYLLRFSVSYWISQKIHDYPSALGQEKAAQSPARPL